MVVDDAVPGQLITFLQFLYGGFKPPGMINNTNAASSQAGMQSGPQPETITARTSGIEGGLQTLNTRFEELRWRLFGDESKPDVVAPGSAGIPPSGPVQRAVENAQQELAKAHNQMSAILDRL